MGDHYLQRTKDDYKLDIDGKHSIFTGQEFYTQLGDLQNGTPAQRQLAEEYERFLALEFFDGEPVDLTPRRQSDVVHIKIGAGGDDFPVFNLGDGLQSMILLTFRAFTTEQDSLFFIDEPEQHLHPGYQRRIMDLYGRSERLTRHQYFLSTHSNHLLDMAVDSSCWSTYVFRKNPDRVFDVLPLVGAQKLVLQELGARSSSVFLTNASLWVEGVTDRLYLRAYLRKYLDGMAAREQLREDTHYSFIEYGGANVTHWDFRDSGDFGNGIRVASVCSHSMVIADGDIARRQGRLADLQGQLGRRLYVLECKEIENLLPEEIVRAAVKRKLGVAERADEIRAAEYQVPDVAMGSYLDEKLGVTKYAAESGTIRPKVSFCHDALQIMDESEWELTEQARKLCAEIVEFVVEMNAG